MSSFLPESGPAQYLAVESGAGTLASPDIPLVAAQIVSGGFSLTYNTTAPMLTNGQSSTPACDINGNLYVNPGVTSATLTLTAPSVTTSNQQILPARNSRQYLFIQNNDSSVTVWLSFGASATTASPSIKLAAGASFTLSGTITNQAVFVIGSSTTSSLTVVEG